MARVQFQRPLESLLSLPPFPAIESHHRQEGVAFVERLIKLKCLSRGGLDLGEGLRWWESADHEGAEGVIGISQADVWVRVEFVFCNRLLVVGDRRPQPLFVSLTRVVAALEVGILGFGIN